LDQEETMAASAVWRKHRQPWMGMGMGWVTVSYHMSPDEFRQRGFAAVEWIARYLESVESYRVQPEVAPGDIRALIPAHPPEHPEPWESILADLDRVVLPGVTHWQSPNWFAYFPANSSGPSVLGDLVSSGLGVQGMLWVTSPACTELETHVLDWLVELLGLPDRFRSNGLGGGVIQDSASSANLCAALAARERAGGVQMLPRLRCYTSTEAHSSVEKGLRIAGLAPAQVRLVETDDDFALRPEALASAIEADVADGLVPFLVVATVGTTSSLAIDPVAAIGDVCSRHGAWLHVDAAMAGSAAVVPDLRFVNDGLEHADSWCFNPHKWLFTTFDCDVMYVADRAPLLSALGNLPEYLRNAPTESGTVIDYRDWQVPLGRRFRALKLWFVLRHYGAEGLRHHVSEHVALAREFGGWVEGDPRLERLAPVHLNLVCFAHVDGDDATKRLLDALNRTGAVALTHARLGGRLAIRVSIGQMNTTRRHVEALWRLIDQLA
jgi:aromatic-L-amino-acid decarboxylase